MNSLTYIRGPRDTLIRSFYGPDETWNVSSMDLNIFTRSCKAFYLQRIWNQSTVMNYLWCDQTDIYAKRFFTENVFMYMTIYRAC